MTTTQATGALTADDWGHIRSHEITSRRIREHANTDPAKLADIVRQFPAGSTSPKLEEIAVLQRSMPDAAKVAVQRALIERGHLRLLRAQDLVPQVARELDLTELGSHSQLVGAGSQARALLHATADVAPEQLPGVAAALTSNLAGEYEARSKRFSWGRVLVSPLVAGATLALGGGGFAALVLGIGAGWLYPKRAIARGAVERATNGVARDARAAMRKAGTPPEQQESFEGHLSLQGIRAYFNRRGS